MKVSLIVAYSKNRAIGKDNQLLWHIPSDLKHFKKLTMGCPVMMGQLTWDSIGRPLPGRLNIVLTRDVTYQVEGAVVVHSFDEAFTVAKNHLQSLSHDVSQVFVIGGGQIYRQALSMADSVYATEVDVEIDGDTYFPELPVNEWQEVAREGVFEENGYHFSFVEYQRV